MLIALAKSCRPRMLPAVLLAVGTAGCSLFHHTAAEPPPAVMPHRHRPHCRSRSPPTVSRSTPSTEIVGYAQRTLVGKEDTLPDIARRFDVGYEEMLLANPGVDPWLPGVGREVVVPTQFVLPAAPHRGRGGQRCGHAHLLLSAAQEGRAAGGLHAPDRHRQGRLEDAGGHDQDRQPHTRIPSGWCRNRCARNMPRTARILPAGCRPGRIIRWASTCSA